MRNSSAIRIVILILLCVGLALGVDRLFTGLITKSRSVEAARVGRIIGNEAGANEIPIFGASKAEDDYIPDILGPAFFNYGFNRSSPDVTNMLLSFEVKRRSDAPIVVDLRQAAFSDIGDVRNFIPYATVPPIRKLLEEYGHWRWYYAVPGLRYFGSYDWYFKGIIADHFDVTHRVARGYAYDVSPTAWDPALFDSYVRHRLTEPLIFGWVERQRQDFLRIIRSAPNRQFIIVLSPVHRSFLVGATGAPAFYRKLDDFRQLPNVRVLDFTRAYYPDRDFRDTGHLNNAGATAFSTQLRALIAGGAKNVTLSH